MNRLLATLPYLSLLGLAGLVANSLLSFEEPSPGVLLVSALLLGTAPVGMVVHIIATRDLTHEERRFWIDGLMSWKGLALFASYFNAKGRSKATQHLTDAANKPI